MPFMKQQAHKEPTSSGLVKPAAVHHVHATAVSSAAASDDTAAAASSSRTSAAGSDVDFDDVKSTGSSHPFSSPNPSEFADDHAASGHDHAIDGKRQHATHKRKKTDSSGSSNVSRLAYPLSERQQLALLMQMTAPEQQDQPKSPASAGIGTSFSGHGGGSFGACHHGATSVWSSPAGQSPSGASVGGKPRGKAARIFRRNDRGETLLHVAAKRGDERQCAELLKEGADVNAVDYAGWTPLHEACNKGWLETAETLIQHGANVNACGLEDDTPLHDAALNGNRNLVILLMEHGADPFKPNAHGSRPVDVAEEPDIVTLLHSAPTESGLGGVLGATPIDISHPTNSSDQLSVSEDHLLSDHSLTIVENLTQTTDDNDKEGNQPGQDDKALKDTTTFCVTEKEETCAKLPSQQLLQKSDYADIATFAHILPEQPMTDELEGGPSSRERDDRNVGGANSALRQPMIDVRIVDVTKDSRSIATDFGGGATFRPIQDIDRAPIVNEPLADAVVFRPIAERRAQSPPRTPPTSETLTAVEDGRVDRRRRRIVTPTRLYAPLTGGELASAIAADLSPNGGRASARKRKGAHHVLKPHRHQQLQQQHKKQYFAEKSYRSQLSADGSLTLSFSDSRGKKRKLEKTLGDVYEFHSSDSELDPLRTTSAVATNSSACSPQRSVKAVKMLVDELDAVRLDAAVTSDELATSANVDMVTHADFEQHSLDAADLSTKSSELRGRSYSLTPAAALKYSTNDELSSSNDSAPCRRADQSSPMVVTTPAPPFSRKERLLGASRRKKGMVNLNAARFAEGSDVDSAPESLQANISTDDDKSFEVAEPAVSAFESSATHNSPLKSALTVGGATLTTWRRCSMADLSAAASHKTPPSSSSSRHSLNSSPKVPPIKLVLSNAMRTPTSAPSTSASAGASAVGAVLTADENWDSMSSVGAGSVPSTTATYFVSRGLTGLVEAASNGEASQRVTRSQVRLHGAGEDLLAAPNSLTSSPLTVGAAASPTPAAATAVHPRKRKIKAAAAVTAGNPRFIEHVAHSTRYAKPEVSNSVAELASRNAYEAHSQLRKIIEKKWQEDKVLGDNIQYTKPRGFDKFLMNRKTYLLQAVEPDRKTEIDSDSKDGKKAIPDIMRDLFDQQEKIREDMGKRHRVERERLIIACETEALRVHNRITRGTVDPPMSAMRVIRDSEIYNCLQLDKLVAVERYSESSSFNDLLLRFTRSKSQLVGRQKLEADCLFSTQFDEWNKEFAFIRSSSLTPEATIDCKDKLNYQCEQAEAYTSRANFPVVTVKGDFELLPAELAL